MRRATDGYILVAVLSVMLVLAGLVASASLVARSALQETGANVDEMALGGLVRGGLEIGAYQLFTLNIPLDAVNGRRVRFGDGTVASFFTDESSKIDINGADPAVLSSVFRSVGLDAARIPVLVSQIVEFRGKAPGTMAASMPPADPILPTAPAPIGTPASGAGDGASSGQTAASSSPRRAGFRSVAEFMGFADLDRTEASSLEPILTVFNPDGRIDVTTASRRVLMALPDMSEALADALMAARGHAGTADLDRLEGTLSKQAAFIKFEDGPAYGVRIEATLASGRVRSANAVIAASKSPDEPYFLLQWED